MNIILALVLAFASVFAAGYSARHSQPTAAAQADGPTPLCPPDASSCN